MKKWKEYKLGEFCEVGRGSSPRPIMDEVYFKDGQIPWIKIADATASGKYIYSTKEYVNEYGASFSRYLDVGSMILAASGSIGQVKFLGVKGCIHDGWLYLSNYNEELVDKEFLYNYLLLIAPSFNSLSYGAAIQNINTEILRETKINLPPIPTQRRIAEVLGRHDALIENYQRQIGILEASAQALYREWFVRGRCPFAHTQEGHIPSDWEEKRLSDICPTITRGVTPVYEEGTNFWCINQKSNKGSYLDDSEFKELKTDFDVPSDKYARRYDVLLNSLGEGTLGRVHFFMGESGELAVDQHMTIIRANDFSMGFYLYHYLSSEEGNARLEALKTGGTNMTMLNISDIRSLPILVPDTVSLQKFGDFSKHTIYKVENLKSQVATLRRMRDKLLPRLLSGQIPIEAAA